MAVAAELRAEPELVLANARLVLAEEVVTGSVAIAGGRIVSVDQGRGTARGAVDCGGALVVPGLVELHTDNLEKHLMPRPKVTWPHPAAVVAHDGELAAAGITTVFDAIRVGSLKHRSGKDYAKYAREVATAIHRMVESGLLRIDHLLHLRCEVCSETVLEEMDEFMAEPMVRIVSIMDHTPGQRQFANIAKYREYHQGKYNLSDPEMEEFIAFTLALSRDRGESHVSGIAERARRIGAVLASHDDMTAAQVTESLAYGIGFAEFPTTLEAARAYHEAGVPVLMGAPNILRGGSHSGNVAAMDLAEAGVLDILSSDYAPSALLMGAMKLAAASGNLPAAIATVTRTPARAVGLTDRGEIAPGQRADLLVLGDFEGLAVVTGVWSAGRKVG